MAKSVTLTKVDVDRWLTKREQAAIANEVRALDLIHGLLDKTQHLGGLTARFISTQTGLAIGIVQAVLRKSTCVLKQKPRNQLRWYADWSDPDLAPYRPRRRKYTKTLK